MLNKKLVTAEIEDNLTLLDLLRNHFSLLGAKEGCGYGECGTCTVIVDGNAVNACLMLAAFVDNKSVLTIEAAKDMPNDFLPLIQSFVDHGAVQCGYCTPGMIMNAKALIDGSKHLSTEEIKIGMAGNLCRCTGYAKIIKAIESCNCKLQ